MQNQHQDHLLILSISMGVFASVMSTSMLTIAFPDMVRDFHISYETLQLRNILFFALFAVGLPFFGKMADHFGACRQYFTGISLFALAALFSGLTHDWKWFLLFQSLQGMADAMIVPAQVLFIRHCFPENKIGWAFGWFSGTLATANLADPAVGGGSVEFDFLVGLAFLSFLFAVIHLPRHIPRVKKSTVRWGSCFPQLAFSLFL